MSETNPYASPGVLGIDSAHEGVVRGQLIRCRVAVVIVMVVVAVSSFTYIVKGVATLAYLARQPRTGFEELSEFPLGRSMAEALRPTYRVEIGRAALALVTASLLLTFAGLLRRYSWVLRRAALGEIGLHETAKAQVACWSMAAILAVWTLARAFLSV